MGYIIFELSSIGFLSLITFVIMKKVLKEIKKEMADIQKKMEENSKLEEIRLRDNVENLDMIVSDFKESVNSYLQSESEQKIIVANTEEIAKKLFNDIYDNPEYMDIIRTVFMNVEDTDSQSVDLMSGNTKQ